MLLSEIGRFGDGIEGLKPSEIISGLPDSLKHGTVGIFWHIGDGRFIIKNALVSDDVNACVEMGQDYDGETNPDDIQIDLNLFHKDIWYDEVAVRFPELREYAWDHFSRGRIILNVLPEKYGLYVPKAAEFTDAHALFLAKEFNIPLDAYEVFDHIYKRKKDMASLTGGELAAINI